MRLCEAIDPLKARFRDFEPDDWPTLYSKFSRAEDFANRVIDPTSPAANSMRRSMMAAWNQWNVSAKTPSAPPYPLADLYGLKKEIAKAIRATAWRPAKAPTWGNSLISAEKGGYIFDTPHGGVFLDAAVINREVWMSEISTEQRGNGLGTDVMNAIHDYAIQHRLLPVKVFKVVNQAFFDRFAWLKRDDSYGGSYHSV